MPNHNQNPGNFANNPSRAAEAGRKGGQNSHGNRERTDDALNAAMGRSSRAESGGFTSPVTRNSRDSDEF